MVPLIKIPVHDEKHIIDLFAANIQNRIIEIALRIEMFEALREPTTSKDLCNKLSIGQRVTDSFLLVFAACGLINDSEGSFQLSDIAREYFLKDSPFYKGDLFYTLPNEELKKYREIYLQDDNPRPYTTLWKEGKVMNEEIHMIIMHEHTFAAAASFGSHLFFSTIRNMLDIAGGIGTASIAIAQQNPLFFSTLMELPDMERLAQAQIDKYKVGKQVKFKSSDMFKDEWSAGHDAVLFSNIFHDWDKTRCSKIAKNAYASLTPGGRIFIIEMLLNEEKNGPLATAIFSFIMEFLTEGKQFTYSELNSLIADSGFVDFERISTFGYYSLLTARKP